MGIQRFERRAGRARRACVRQAFGSVPRRARVQTAQHEGHEFPGDIRAASASCRRSRQRSSEDQPVEGFAPLTFPAARTRVLLLDAEGAEHDRAQEARGLAFDVSATTLAAAPGRATPESTSTVLRHSQVPRLSARPAAAVARAYL